MAYQDEFNNDDFKELLHDWEKDVESGFLPFIDADDAMDLAQYYDSRSETDKLREVLQHAISLHPGDDELLSFMARICMMIDDNEEAAFEYLSQIEEEDSFGYVLGNSDYLIYTEKYDEADKLLENKLHLFNEEDQTNLCVESAQMLIFVGEYNRAAKWLNKSPQKDSPDFLELEAEVLMEIGDLTTCEEHYNKLLDRDSFSTTNWNNLAAVQIMQNKLDEAIESTDYVLAIDSNDLKAQHNKAYALYKKGELEQALEILLPLCKKVNGTKDSQYNEVAINANTVLGHIMIDLGRYSEAAMMFMAAAELLQGYDQQVQEVDYGLVFSLIACKEYEAAKVHIQRMKRNYPKEMKRDLQILDGYVALKMGDLDRTFNMFTKALSGKKTSSDLLMKEAVAFFDCEYYGQAALVFERIIHIKPYDRGWAYLAMCMKKCSNYDTYLQILKTACEVNPEEVETVFGDQIKKGTTAQDFYEKEKLTLQP